MAPQSCSWCGSLQVGPAGCCSAATFHHTCPGTCLHGTPVVCTYCLQGLHVKQHILPMQLCCPAGCSGGFMPLTRMQCHLGQKGAAPQQPHQSTAGPGSSAVCGSRLMLCRAALTAARPPLPRPSRKGCHPGRHLLLSSPMRPPPPRLPQHQGGRTSMLVLQASLKPLLRPGLAAHRGHGAAGRPEALVAPWLGSTSRLLHSDAGACIICLHLKYAKHHGGGGAASRSSCLHLDMPAHRGSCA